jgi:hypothetical protein
MYCNFCGAANPDDANFCSKCGKALGVAGGGSVSPVVPPTAPPIPIAPPAMEILTPPPAEPDQKEPTWVFMVAAAFVAVLLFLVIYSNSGPQNRSASAEAKVEAASSPPRKREGTLSTAAIGCERKESAEKFETLRSAGDRQAVNLMLLSGMCEVVYSGTRLDMDDLSIFGISRYRLYGTARTLYVPNPEFQ